MKIVKLKKITLSNFKSINLSVDFNENTTTIKGRNGIGKSTIQSAWNWLLSSYTNANVSKNHELFDNREELTKDTPQAVVTAIVEVDGCDYTIEKSATAKFTRPRGEEFYVKAPSDVYAYKIDNIETSATAFGDWIESNICPQDMITYCLDGTFFANLCENDKNKARKVLEQIIGDIKNSDFKGDYEIISKQLERYTIEEIEEQTKAQIKPLDKRLNMLPAIIADSEKRLAEYNEIDFETILSDIENKRQDIEDIDNQILGKAESIKPILGKRDAIFEVINRKSKELNDKKNAYENGIRTTINEMKSKIANIERVNEENKRINKKREDEYAEVERKLGIYQDRLKGLNDRRNLLLEQRDEVKGRVFTDTTCPTCGQELTDDLLVSAKNKFLAKQKVDLDYIVRDGKMVREEIEVCQETINKLQEEYDKGFEILPYEVNDDLKEQLEDYQANVIQFEYTDEYKRLSKEIDELNATLPEIPQNDNQALTDRKRALMGDLDELNRTYGLSKKRDELMRNINGLYAEKKTVAAELAHQERILAKCKEWVEERADIISNRINDKMTDCKIVMFSQQKNGEQVPDCIITDVNGVKYSTLNNSNRIKTCISLQRLFCQYFDVILPIFIDEYDCFDSFNVPKFDTQAIYMGASDDNFLNIQ